MTNLANQILDKISATRSLEELKEVLKELEETKQVLDAEIATIKYEMEQENDS